MLKELLKNKEIILASGSPRRHQFFKDLDIPFKADVRPVKEVHPDYLKKEEITDFLAQLKAEAFQKELKKDQILITSDTIVYNEGNAMGKPATTVEAKEMLRSLSGKTHSVFTSVCFTTTTFEKTLHNITKVTFKDLSDEEINFYIENYKPFDKAGAYAIQGKGHQLISTYDGDFFTIMGLPIKEVIEAIENIKTS